MTTNRYPRASSRRSALRTSLAPALLIPALLLVPAALPLCDMGAEACVTMVAEAAAASSSSGAHCPMNAMARQEMPCCVRDAAPPGPSPAAPAKADSDLRAPFQVLAPASVAPPAEAALPAVPSAPAPAAPTASAVPLYTLLSTLLN